MSNNDQIIAASLKVDSDDAVKNVLKLKGEVVNLRKAFKDAEAGSDAQLAALKKLNAAEAELTKTTQQLSGANQQSTSSFSSCLKETSSK